MKEDYIELIGNLLLKQVKTKKEKHFQFNEIGKFYKFISQNYSPTSIREFVKQLKDFQIIIPVSKAMCEFNEEKFKEYLIERDKIFDLIGSDKK